jgi:hypothetical protein
MSLIVTLLESSVAGICGDSSAESVRGIGRSE